MLESVDLQTNRSFRRRIRPLTGGLKPVPRIASRYKSPDRAIPTRSSLKSSLEWTKMADIGNLSNMAAASPRRSTLSASKMT